MRLKIRIVDSNEEKTYCKLVLSEVEDNKIIKTQYCCGEYDFELAAGQYRITAYKGKLYWPHQKIVELKNRDLLLELKLIQLINPIDFDLYSFDAHSHTSRDENLQTGNPLNASIIMQGEDFNFLFAGSPYDQEVHLQYLARNFTAVETYREKYGPVINEVNSDQYRLDIGNELVKCRYGHVCMMNFEQKSPFSQYYDEAFDPWLFTKVGSEPKYQILYPYEAIQMERGENSIAFLAHPTSWWWHDNGEFITNIATTLGFEILAGTIDAIVIMGYKSDHKFYQELWYQALSNGYFLPGIAETDVAFDDIDESKIQFKTYAYLNEFTINDLCHAIRQGRCMVTSGPLLMMKINGNLPGTVYNYLTGDHFTVEIKAFRCYEGMLSKIELIINGDIYKEYHLNATSYELQECIEIQKDSFIIAKCYDEAGNVAIVNPVYFRNQPFAKHSYLSNVNINVINDGQPASGTYWIDDDPIAKKFDSTLQLKMKLISNLHIEVDGHIKVIKLFEIEALQAIFRNLYMGCFNVTKKYQPGEVAASEFKLSEIKEILDHVNLTIKF